MLPTKPTPPPDEKVIPIKPTLRNFRRHSTMLYAGITALSLIGLITLVNLKPSFYTGIQGRITTPTVVQVPYLIDNCQLIYDGCHDPISIARSLPYPLLVQEDIRQLSQEQDINPAVLLTLYQIIYLSPDIEPSLQILTPLSIDFNRHRMRTTPVPNVYHHPSFGRYNTHALNRSSFVLTTFIANRVASKSQLDNAIAEPHLATDPSTNFLHLFSSLNHRD